MEGNLNKGFPFRVCAQAGHNASIELLFAYVKTSIAQNVTPQIFEVLGALF